MPDEGAQRLIAECLKTALLLRPMFAVHECMHIWPVPHVNVPEE